MKVGLLECDHVREEFRPIAGDYRDMFPALFMPLAPDWEFVFYDVANGHFPASVEECEVYLCTGSKSSVYDDEPWIHALKAFVQQIYAQQKIFLGVCFGHQMLAEALGGKVQKSAVGWCVGIHEFTLEKPMPAWANPSQERINLLMMCQDQVHQLPPDSTVLASADDCPVAMFRVGERMLGVQAHPEFPVLYEEALMRSRVERIGVEKTAKGLESLSLPLHGTLMAQWMAAFVKSVL
ncbi:glutamine amidotransferase-related protein [Runella slithyformis]|uniref:Glutamine amidotransferase class-I n=1 Tax=Runella slithyformis (strain ATCC 29530 / DSM 19594 / LMG 11500 / NCIMB 11436 / LSU 4) TaxID=761193 RepID=A0A7U3ZKD1_RUNSL|nr:gamma-glutamyl-gamma-aminobutyrate hydrolase family protein [Runella slithyformis]AEI48827.1 glutamine amidotransferase class-I [Runella slithyformis DSM 19594]